MARQHKQDVVIVGSGPGGASSALFLLKRGIKPLILEKESFPRYHIGESLTGECGLCFRELGLEHAMTAARHPVKWGVKVFGANGKNGFWVPVAKRNADHALEPTFTWQVRRSTFDRFLLDTARERGAEVIQGQAIAPLMEGGRVAGVRIETSAGERMDIAAEVVIDASGQATFLASRGRVTGVKERGSYDRQVAIFSQVLDAVRDPGEASGNTLIFYRQKNHWAWFIPLDDEVVSVGVVVPSDYLNAQQLSKEAFLKKELIDLNPELARRLPNLEFIEEVRGVSNYSYHIRDFTGPGHLCVGDSHRFIDPIFSFGLYFSVKEAQAAAAVIEDHLGKERTPAGNPFADYQRWADHGQDIIQMLVDCFWDYPLPFAYLVHHKFKDEMIDLFAGRVYGEEAQSSPGTAALRSLLAQPRERAPATH
jgi:flavin-dependent dehydrogenase